MKTSKTLFETLQDQGYLFFIKHPECKGDGTLLFKNGVYTYMPEFRRSFDISEDQAKQLLESIK